VAGSCEHGNEVSGSKNCQKLLSSRATGGFSRKTRLHGVNKLVRMFWRCNLMDYETENVVLLLKVNMNVPSIRTLVYKRRYLNSVFSECFRILYIL
jgi:hypothetical protein